MFFLRFLFWWATWAAVLGLLIIPTYGGIIFSMPPLAGVALLAAGAGLSAVSAAIMSGTP